MVVGVVLGWVGGGVRRFALVVGHPEGYQVRCGGASGGGSRRLTQYFAFATGTPAPDLIVLRMPDDESDPPRGFSTLRAARYRLVAEVVAPRSIHSLNVR